MVTLTLTWDILNTSIASSILVKETETPNTVFVMIIHFPVFQGPEENKIHHWYAVIKCA